MRLTEEVINDIRNSASISEVIGHYIPLVKKGKGFTALCPFHDDHDPSLSISEDKQIYKCFVCGSGGNVFSFVRNFKKVSFQEAVVEVADIIGKPLEIDEPLKPKKIDKNQKYYDLLNSMRDYASYLLLATKSGLDAKEYLLNRGLEEEQIRKFNIGYDPGDSGLYKYLNKQGFSDEDMISAYVARMSDRGMNDIFYNRILFPIENINGDTIAYTARDFRGNSNSKYINSADTPVYNKGHVIYNYHRAKELAKQLGSVIVCEGVMDVIAYDRCGIENVVATLGTACTNEQLDLLQSLSKTIVLSYDGDKAGQAANLKIGELCMSRGLNVMVIDNRTEKDPDEIVNEFGKNALRDLSGKRVTFLDYVISFYQKNYNLENYQDRKKMAMKLFSLIDLLKDDYDKDNYLNEVYELTKIRKRQSEDRKKEYNNKVIFNNYTIDGLTRAEYIILSQISLSNKAKDLYQKELGCLLMESNQDLAMLIIDEYRRYGSCSLSRLFDEVENKNIKELIVSLSTIESLPSTYDEAQLK